MSSAVPQQRRRRWRIIVTLLLVMLASIGLIVWHIHTRIDQSGARFRLVWPGQPLALDVGGAVPPLTVSGELAAAGARAEGIEMSGSGEGMVFVNRERISLLMWMTAGNEALETTQLRYVLFADDGSEIGHGIVQPPVRIEAGKTVSTEVIHPRVADAARIEIRKLP